MPREMTLSGTAGEHELRDADDVRVRLRRQGAGGTGAVAEAADGVWTFAGHGVVRPSVTVTDAGGAEVARLEPRGLTGAKGVVTVGDAEYAYATEGSRATRLVLSEGDRPLLTVEADAFGSGPAEVAADEGVSDLLLAIACYCAVQSTAVAAASSAT